MNAAKIAVAILAVALAGCTGMSSGTGNNPAAFRAAVGACQIPAARRGSNDVMRDCLRHRGWQVERRVGFSSAARQGWPIEVQQ